VPERRQSEDPPLQQNTDTADGLAISVVVPHYNQPLELAQCLQSLAAQRGDFMLAEIIVVDNASEVLPEAICRRFDGVTLLVETQRGPGPVRNRGARQARGDILAFIDADCVAAPGWLAAITAAFAEAPPGTILGGDVRIPRDAGSLGAVAAFESVFAYRMDKYIAQQNFTGTGNLAVRRETFEAVGPFCAIDRAEDRDWGHRATALGFTLSFQPAMRAYHPARGSFAELARKWDRQLAHDYAAIAAHPRARLRWLVRAVAVAASPLAAAPEVMATERLSGLQERVAALGCLLRIRLYRSLRMFAMLSGRSPTRSLGDWTRSSA